MKKLTLLFVFLFISAFAFSQLSSIYYELQYNEGTDLFDCKLYPNGVATTAAERLQIDGKYSIIVETGTTIAIAENSFPLYNNETYTGTVPMTWSIESVEVNPAELPGYDIIGIVPDVNGPPAHYNNLTYETYVTLFSLSAVGGDICPLSLRVFENDDDPTSLPSGNEFANTMMIGGPNDIYAGNLTSSNVWADVDVTVNQGSICLGDCITLTATFNCIFPGLTYEWSTGETTESITVCPDFSTQYILDLDAPFEYGDQVIAYVNVDQDIDTGESTKLCVGVPVYYFPEVGIWSSSDETIVTVTNEGYVTPISVGSATLTHTNELGDCADEVVVTVLQPDQPMIIGDDVICAGQTTQLSPSTGVTWESGNPSVATVDNTGLVTGVDLGATVFSYTTVEGCISDPTPAVSVLIIPEPKITGLDTICTQETTTLTPSAGVTWESSDTSIAKIDNSGHVTGVSGGSTTFYFADMATGCTSDESEAVTILPTPVVQLSADTVCQGENVVATTNIEGGSWILTLISIFFEPPTIDILTGEILTSESGTVNVHYISADGCMSDGTMLTILPKPTFQLLGNSSICSGQHIVISPILLPEGNNTFEWTGPNGFSSNEEHVAIIYTDESNAGEYTLVVVSENGCASDELTKEVIVKDCNPCDDMMIWDDWNKVPARDGWSAIGDYEIGGSLVTGRELDDFVYYHYSQFEIRLFKNGGNGKFEDEIILFDLPYFGPNIEIDIVDIDQDGLNDIVTYQSENSTGTNDPGIMTIKVFKNLDNYLFEEMLSIVGENSGGYSQYPPVYKDIDNQGFLDIVPYVGSLHFTDNWEVNSVILPINSLYILIEDVDEDGLLDVLGYNGINRLFTNNGDRTFSESTISGDVINRRGLYDYETGVFIEGNKSYQITKGDNPSTSICNDPGINPSLKYFFANINSNSKENGVVVSNTGFFTFETPLTCENSDDYEPNYAYKPNEGDKIDITGNGYTDFIEVENGSIFAWINPNEQPKIRGTAYIDKNADGILNDNDIPLRNVLISIEPGSLSVLTDDNGSYQFVVSEGTYTLTANVNEGEWIMEEITIENIEVSEPCNLGFDFGFVPDPNALPMVNLSMVNTIARCDFETKFTITVENTGTEPFESQLQFEFDDKTTFFSTEITGATVVGNKVTTDIGPLAPFQPQKYIITVKMPNGSSVLPMLDFKATLLNEAGEKIKEYGYTEQLRCSYDPNDKREFPDREGDENLTLMEEAIEYTIRFQNNGNDTAYTVKIIDPLDSNIEPSSIRVVGSSHDVETCIEGTDLIFLFEDIYLVDSSTDYASSQGYVTFKCNAKEGRAEYTPVNNTAEIFFDTNLPIATNQTLNTLVSVLCTDKSTVIDKYICDGEEYLGYSESGTYTESFELPFGCDSLVTINLTVQGITVSQQSFNVCEPGIIYLGLEEYYIDASTTIIDTIINDQGCISHILKYEITLVPDLIDIAGSWDFCINEVASIFPILDGVWSSDDESVVIVDPQGNITTINPGNATLQFIDNATGCFDEISVVVYPEPIIINEGSDEICINENNQLSSDTEGTWTSSDPEVATISFYGLVLGKKAGTVTFTFTSSTTLCSKSIEMVVLPPSDSNCTVSTDDLSPESVMIYPNPAAGFLTIESKEAWNTVKLLNTDGKVVYINEITQFKVKQQLDLNEISSGLYFLVIEKESGVIMKKLVVR